MQEIIIHNVIEIRKAILKWGNNNMRKFPWRETNDPYKILMAEIFLHRTAVRQVLPVYIEFIEMFPDIANLYKAPDIKIRKSIQGLGLNWRLEGVIVMKKYIIEKLGGIIPCEKNQLKEIPGISDYIASAVRISAFKCVDTPLDTNTVRITGRVFDMEITDSSRRNEKFRQGLSLLINPDEPRKSFYALLDIGNAICKKNKTDCNICPIAYWCRKKLKSKYALIK